MIYRRVFGLLFKWLHCIVWILLRLYYYFNSIRVKRPWEISARNPQIPLARSSFQMRNFQTAPTSSFTLHLAWNLAWSGGPWNGPGGSNKGQLWESEGDRYKCCFALCWVTGEGWTRPAPCAWTGCEMSGWEWVQMKGLYLSMLSKQSFLWQWDTGC